MKSILFSVVFITLSIQLLGQDFYWQPPDDELRVVIKENKVKSCKQFLKDIPVTGDKDPNWLGKLDIRYKWNFDVQNDYGNDSVAMRLKVMEYEDGGATTFSYGQATELQINLYEWPEMPEVMMKKIYDNFYLYSKEKYNLSKSLLEAGEFDAERVMVYSTDILSKMNDMKREYRNEIDENNIIESTDDDPLVLTYRMKDSLYFMYLDYVTDWLDKVDIQLESFSQMFDQETIFGLNSKDVISIDDIECQVCCNKKYQPDTPGIIDSYELIAGFEKNKYELTPKIKQNLDRFLDLKDNRVDMEINYVAGRASYEGNENVKSAKSLGNESLSFLRAYNVCEYLNDNGLKCSKSKMQCLGSRSTLQSRNNLDINRSVMIGYSATLPSLPPRDKVEVRKKEDLYCPNLLDKTPSNEWSFEVKEIIEFGINTPIAQIGLGTKFIKCVLTNNKNTLKYDVYIGVVEGSAGANISLEGLIPVSYGETTFGYEIPVHAGESIKKIDAMASDLKLDYPVNYMFFNNLPVHIAMLSSGSAQVGVLSFLSPPDMAKTWVNTSGGYGDPKIAMAMTLFNLPKVYFYNDGSYGSNGQISGGIGMIFVIPRDCEGNSIDGK